MPELTPFLEIFGAGHDCEAVPAERVQAFKGVLPDSLLELWGTEGACGYMDGLLWFVDPAAYADVLAEWAVEGYTPFARTGFGDILLWSGQGISLLSVHLGGVNHIATKFEVFFNQVLSLASVRDDFFQQKMHDAVLRRLGRVAPDESYAYVPALALGGSRTAENVQRVKMREQLSILAQIHGRGGNG